MKKIFSVLFIALLFTVVFSEDLARPYVPFVYGTYTEGQRVRIDVDRDKKIDRLEFSWSDESEDNNTRVELYVDSMYRGSKRVFGYGYDSFWVNREARFRVELRVRSGKVRIRRGYVTYYPETRGMNVEDKTYLALMEKAGINENRAIELFNNMTEEEQIIAGTLAMAVADGDEAAVAHIEEEYSEFIRENDAVDVSDLLVKGESGREYLFAGGYHSNYSTIRLYPEKGRKIRTVSVSWRRHQGYGYNDDDDKDTIRLELYINGLYQGSKSMYSFSSSSYDTFYCYGEEVDYGMSLRVRGGDIYISSVNVSYEPE
ncbi:MAG: hypothetical protein ACOCWO_01955 [Candidatus Muiribacteriaceae bacterium]